MDKKEIIKIYGEDYKEMTKRLLAACRLETILKDKADKRGIGEEKTLRIGIKPNLVSASEASWGATTHPELSAGIIEYLQERGFENISMLESSWVGGRTDEAYELCGYRALSEKYGVPFYDLQKDTATLQDCAGMELKICERAGDIDFLINVPVLKGHCQTKITCALKNMKGLIPGSEKRRFHSLGLHLHRG